MFFFLFVEVLYILVDLHEFVVRGDIETRSFFEQCFNNLLLGVGFYRIVTLNPRQVSFECPVIFPQFIMVNNEQGRAVLLY